MRLKWDQSGERHYETGVSKGVLYPVNAVGAYGKGVAWNGLTNVTESPSGAEPTALYADNIKYLNLMSAEEFSATIECYMYPYEFGECNGMTSLGAGITGGIMIGQQRRKGFGFAFETIVGNDTLKNQFGRKIHIIYGCEASPTESAHGTVNESPEAATMSFEVTTTPVEVTGAQPTSQLIIDSTAPGMNEAKMKAIEDVLFGTETSDPRLPLPDEVVAIINAASVQSIAVTTPPTKTAYIEGELFDPTGMVITATYADSSTAVIDNYTYAPMGALSESDTTITISYGGKSVTQAITVTEAAG